MSRVLVLAVFLVSAQTAFATEASIEGVWAVVLQQRDCTTDAPIGPPLRKLETYQRGGTLAESSVIPVFLPGQRSDGHGIWRRRGLRTFTDRTVTMIAFDSAAGTPPGSPGFLAGWQVASARLTMTGPDTFTATSTSDFYNLSHELYRTTCASRSARRIK